jgi:pilus assembly protein CpaB
LRTTAATASSDNERPVVIATVNIPYGQRIERHHVSVVALTRSGIPANTFSEVAAVEGKIARQEILKGDIVRSERVANHQGGSTLAAMIGENKRAITVRVNDVVGVAGFLLPGNQVDVVAAKTKSRGNAEAETILTRIRVLAVDQSAGDEKEGRPAVVRAVTLEVTPMQAETLVKATEEGYIQLVLRNPMDLSEPVVAVKEEPKPEPPPVVRRPAPRPTSSVVTVIRGVETSTTRVTQ